jgi:glycine/D-amino acid oxidase-like deaminating enzyme
MECSATSVGNQALVTYTRPAPANPVLPLCMHAGARTSGGRSVHADVVVLACGPSVQALAAQAQVQAPMLHKPARITLTSALAPGLLRTMVCASNIFLVQVGGAEHSHAEHCGG